MAAGLGFKTFTTGEVLTAADVNGYLNSQTVMVFADATARTAAITSPQEGMFTYLKDTNVTQYYTGSAWANLDTTGMVNPMTTTGDTIYSSSGSTPARLGIGSTGNVLTVAGGVPTWAAPGGAGANWTLLNTGGTTLSGSSTVTVSGISGADKVMVLVGGASTGAVNPEFKIRLNADSANNYTGYGAVLQPSSSYSASAFGNTDGGSIFGIHLGNQSVATSGTVSGHVSITGCNAAGVKLYQSIGAATASGSTDQAHRYTGGAWNNSATVTSVSIITSSGTFDNGLIFVYTSA
jgi:hypothetical protein